MVSDEKKYDILVDDDVVEEKVKKKRYDITQEECKALFTPFTDASNKLREQGGLEKLAAALKTDLHNGIPQRDVRKKLKRRRKYFGTNEMPEVDPPSFFALFIDGFKDHMIIILMIAAVVSLFLGICFPPEGESRIVGSIEGFAILGAVLLVTIVGAVTNYKQEIQFQQTNKQSDDVTIKVRRGGVQTQCQIGDLVVGDIVLLGSGDRVPADGYIVEHHNLTIDETILTGESEAVKKTEENNFILRGTDLQNGNCEMLVVNVGVNTEWLSNFEKSEFEETPLQVKLGVIATRIGFVGLGVAALVFLALCIQYIVTYTAREKGTWEPEDLTEILSYFIVAVTIVVVAVPEGLPLAVTVALAFSMKKMMKDNNFVRHLSACETMGGATQICSDKTGTLTLGQMNVTKGFVAGERFENPEIKDLNDAVHHHLTQGIAINSTAFIEQPTSSDSKIKLVGSATECALLLWIGKLGVDYENIRNTGPKVVTQFPFSSKRKRMSCVVKLDDGYRMYTKGASEIILRRCTSYLKSDSSTEELTEELKTEYFTHIDEMASKGLRTLCMAYRDFEVFDETNDFDTEDEPPEMKLTLISLVGIADPVRPEVPNAVKVCQGAGITVRMVTGDNILTAKSIATQCGILSKDGIAMEGPEFAKKTDEEIDALLPNLQVLARSAPTDKERLVYRLKLATELVSVTGDGANDVKALKKAHIGLAMGGGSDVAKQASDIVILDDNFTSILKSVMWGRCVFDNIRKFLQFQLTVNVAALVIAGVSALFGLTPLTAVQLLWVNLVMDSFGALALATEPPTEDLLLRSPKNVAHPKMSLLSPEMWKMIIGQSIFQVGVLLGGLLSLQMYANKHCIYMTELEKSSVVFNAFIFCQLFNLIACRKINKGEYNIFSGIHKNFIFIAILILEVVVQVILVGYTTDPYFAYSGENSYNYPTVNCTCEGTYSLFDPPYQNTDEGKPCYVDTVSVEQTAPDRLIPGISFLGLIFETVPIGWQMWLISIAVGFVGFLWGIILKFIPVPEEKSYKGDPDSLLEEEELSADYDFSETDSLLKNPIN